MYAIRQEEEDLQQSETEARVAVGRGEGGMPSLTISAAAAWPCLVAWVLVSNVNRTINSA